MICARRLSGQGTRLRDGAVVRLADHIGYPPGSEQVVIDFNLRVIARNRLQKNCFQCKAHAPWFPKMNFIVGGRRNPCRGNAGQVADHTQMFGGWRIPPSVIFVFLSAMLQMLVS